MNKTLRNVLIVIAVAAAVAFVPGGGDTAAVVRAFLSIAISVTFVLLGMRFYRENRVTIFSLGDTHRGLLYGALGAIVVALAGRDQLTNSGIGSIVFVALLVGAVGALYAVWQHYRSYGY
ncbi:MAG TPA: hypothetical protein VI318_04260 [Baekduia sp.]